MVTKTLFPMFQHWTRDYTARVGLYPQILAKEFAEALASSKLTMAQIENGIRAFKANAAENPWMPNPAEFVELCMGAGGLGLPGYREAYLEACRYAGEVMDAKWTHPAVYVAGKAAGWFDLRNKPEKETWPIFKQAYKDALARVAAGEDLQVSVPKAQIEQRDVFKAKLDTPGRLKALSMIRRLNK